MRPFARNCRSRKRSGGGHSYGRRQPRLPCQAPAMSSPGTPPGRLAIQDGSDSASQSDPEDGPPAASSRFSSQRFAVPLQPRPTEYRQYVFSSYGAEAANDGSGESLLTVHLGSSDPRHISLTLYISGQTAPRSYRPSNSVCSVAVLASSATLARSAAARSTPRPCAAFVSLFPL